MPGGKGANQAVACARLGGTAKMIGRVGADLFGAELLSSLQAHGVDVAGVTVDNGRASGIAQIAVDDTGENNIIVVPGANGLVGPAELAHLETALQQATVLLLQCEIPLDTVIAAARLAQERGVLVILDPAPARPLPADLYPLIDIITPNETETALLLGFPITGEPAMQHACDQLLARGVKQVIIKLGARGVFVSGLGLRPSFPVTAVDTVAAGDAFNGSLAAALHQGLSFAEALNWGLAAGALAVTHPGAQAAIPTLAQLHTFLNENNHKAQL
jgi:ribokinase